jgi:K+-transporting ATPase A subunit
MVRAAIQIAAFIAVLTLAAVPLGGYLQRVFTPRRVALERLLGPVERGGYRCCASTRPRSRRGERTP